MLPRIKDCCHGKARGVILIERGNRPFYFMGEGSGQLGSFSSLFHEFLRYFFAALRFSSSIFSCTKALQELLVFVIAKTPY